MENSADQSINQGTIINNGVEFRSPDQKVPRRRFVQSTLFPLKPHDNKSDNLVEKEVKKVEEINVVDDDVVECCGSQGGKKKVGRKRKINSTPQKRKPRKVAGNGKDDCIVSIDDIESPVGSPQQPKEKQHTPTRKGRNSGNKKTSTAKTPTRQASTHQVPQTVPDLWQEAKKTAEENSRIFAGKQIHPFFSSWKAGKKEQEIIEVEGDECLDKRKERNADFKPIHVFEDDKDNVNFYDWGNWTFFDGPFSKISCNQGTPISSFEGTAVPLNIDTGIVSNPCGTSLLHKDVSSSQYFGAHEQTVITRPASPVVVDEEVTPIDLQNIEKELKESELFISGLDDQLNSDLKPQNLQDRMKSQYLSRSNQPENSLWTNKYQPEKASEVCGNGEAVKFMNDWLRLWHAADFRVRKKSSNADNFIKDDDSDDSDSDAEYVDEAPSLKNVLLVSGPVGSGKSAAIYACAKEQGFEVIEVNASDWRSGAILKQKFGEAVGLHWLKRSQENLVGSKRKLDFNSSPTVNRHGAQGFDLNDDAVEVISLSQEESVDGAGTQTNGDARLCTDQGEIKTLLLFEDVDATLCEDRGFISTIQQLADTGKKPMILTSNNENPELPNNLVREEISFARPSLKELTSHIYLVCAAEKACVQPHLIERCIKFCGGDIRKCLTHLQFWCQRKGCIKDVKNQSMNSPLMHSLAAIHCTLPKLIPWALPSSLSEFIEAEIVKSLHRVEQDQCLLDIFEEHEGNMLNNLYFDKGEADIIIAKKEAILKGNCFLPIDDDNIVNSLSEFSNCSGSPIAFFRRNTRKRIGIVLSDSDEELPGHEKPAVSNGLSSHINHNLLPVPSSVLEDASNKIVDHSLNYGTAKVEDRRHHFSEASDANHIDSLALGNLCNQPTDLFIHSASANYPEPKYHCPRRLRRIGIELSDSDEELPGHEKPAVSNGLSSHINHNLLTVPCPVLEDASNEIVDHPLNYGTAKVEDSRHASDANHIDSLALGNICNQPTDLSVHSASANYPEPKYHCRQLLDLNTTFCEEPREMEVSGNQFPPMPHVHEEIPAIVTDKNHSSDQPNHIGEVKVAETVCRTASNNDLNPLNDQLQQCVQTNTIVGRCLFPSTASTDPIGCTIGGLGNCSFEGSIHHKEANMIELRDLGTVTHGNQEPFTMENSREKQSAFSSLNLFSYQTLHVSSNSEAKGKGIWHQHAEAGEQTLKFCTALGGHSSQSNGQYISPTIQEEIQIEQQQHSGSDWVNNTLCLLPDVSLKQFQHTGVESVFHQSLKRGNIRFTGCQTEGNSMSHVGGKALKFIDAKSEEQQNQYSDSTNVNHMIDRCWSADVSCVPESTFVPETEVNDGTEIPAGMDAMDIMSPLTGIGVDTSILRLDVPETAQTEFDLNVNVTNEDMGDSQSDSEHLEASTSGCQVMDECSRMDFCKKPKRLRSSMSKLKFPVQDKWNELRLTDLRQYYTSEHEDALQSLDLTVGVTNLISDGDLLLNDCEFLINDSSNQDIDLREENFTFGWYDQQVQITSAIAEHGYCLYAKEINALQLKMGADYSLHLNWELLTSTNNSITLGKLLRLNSSKSQSSVCNSTSKLDAPTADSSITRVRETCLANIVRSISPLKSYLALKGNALHDYLSSLAYISRSEASRLADREAAQKTKRRRVRATKNYLMSGALDLSPNDISLLNKYNSYGKSSP